MDLTKTTCPREASNDAGSSPSNSLVPALERIDPFLRFLTKATGKTIVPLHMLYSVLPERPFGGNENNNSADFPRVGTGCPADTDTKKDHNDNLPEILLEMTYRGVLYYQPAKQMVGFPLPPSSPNTELIQATVYVDSPTVSSLLQKPPSKLIGKGLHGSSEAAAKRRMKVLMWTLEKESNWICRMCASAETWDTGKGDEHTTFDTKGETTPAESTTEEPLSMGQSYAFKSDIVDDDDGKFNLTPDNVKPNDILEAANKQGDRISAYQALHSLFSKTINQNISISTTDTIYDDEDVESKQENHSKKHWLPRQVAYAGSHPGREPRYSTLSANTLDKIPLEVLHLFNLDIDVTSASSSGVKCNYDNSNRKSAPDKKSVYSYESQKKRKLFLHQARAIDAAMSGVHTVVCTGTGSGKSLCFLLPVIAQALTSLQQKSAENAVNSGSASILLFPTKALAQDQFTKINSLLQSLPWQSDGASMLRAGVIDGDTPYSQRDTIASECQIILTNPDTLHAAILPNWKRPSYRDLLARVATVVIDEAHVYEGTFGAHVALVLARLKRICTVAYAQTANWRDTLINQSIQPILLFIACSATMIHPEHHFRILCPIAENESVCVLASAEDGSPCAPKHFFVWNPPILDINGNSTNSVFLPKPARDTERTGDYSTSNDNMERGIAVYPTKKRKRKASDHSASKVRDNESASAFSTEHVCPEKFIRRRHAADETAILLAKAITSRVRCIAFCKTRFLVEWVYESCLSILRSDTLTSHLVSKIESYRGGYSADARRSIEDRLFRGELLGVVGTNALELGVDVGGIDLTLHCGYPGSRNSLLQQSGRAGRGRGSQSCSVIVCFSNPSEQFLWKAPKTVLSKGVNGMSSLPIHGSLLQGHILCAGEEFPLNLPISCLLNDVRTAGPQCPLDEEIFGSRADYHECVEQLIEKSLLQTKVVRAVQSGQEVVDIICHETHPVMKNSWKRVDLRSIEPLNYAIIDLSHPLQGGRTDKIHDKAAVLDTIPYSRVFYHAFPGAIIMHRGSRYKIESMESPPPFLGGATFGRSGCTDLLAFARPAQVSYSTQALSISEITVVKQVDSMEIRVPINEGCLDTPKAFINNNTPQTVAGTGIVTVKRSVHGYKKLSHVHRKEISRTSIVLPSMEFDTSAVWIDADAINLRDAIVSFDSGVHALSHAMVAVAPLYTPCTSADIDCDHSRFECTRILLFDTRAGGSGTSSLLYGQLIELVRSAIELLDDCTSCHSEAKYDGGCPGCLLSVPCDNFHQNLSRSAGIIIGKHLLERLQNSTMNVKQSSSIAGPRKTTAIGSVKPKSVLIGRPSWLENRENSQFAEVDE